MCILIDSEFKIYMGITSLEVSSCFFPPNFSRALPRSAFFLSGCVDVHPSSRLRTSAVSSCTRALCDVK